MSFNVAQNIKQTTQSTLDALNAWNLDALVALRTHDFVFQGLPHSLGLPPMDNEQYKEMWFGVLTPMFQTFKVCTHNLDVPWIQIFDL